MANVTNRLFRGRYKSILVDGHIYVLQLVRYIHRYPLKTVRRGIENEPCDVARYLIRSMHAESLMRVDANFGLNQYRSVSSSPICVKAKLQEVRKFKDRLEYIEVNIVQGQTYPLISILSRLLASCNQQAYQPLLINKK